MTDGDTGPGAQRSKGRIITRAGLAVIAALAVLVVVVAAAPAGGGADVDILQLEFAGSADAAVTVLADAVRSGADGTEVGTEISARVDAVFDALGEQLDADDVPFIPVYSLALIVALLVLVRLRERAGTPSTGRAWHGWSIVGVLAMASVVLAAMFDYLENDRLRTGLAELRPLFPDPVLPVTAASDETWAVASFFAGTKFALLALAIAVLVSMTIAWVATGFSPPPARRPPPLPDEVEEEWVPADGRIGVSCSGGGVRSATFSLGVLQVLDERGILPRARYVTAVSGGGYMAASWAIAQDRADPDARPEPARARDGRRIERDGPRPVYAPRSPEERWARLHSSHLVASSLVLLAGALRLIAGILFGWLLIWLMMFAVARPIGWVISSPAVHPELRARTPILETRTQPVLVGQPAVEFVERNQFADPPYSVYAFAPSYSCATLRSWSDTTGPDAEVVSVGLATTGRGVVRVERGEATVVEQPTLEPVRAGAATDASGDTDSTTSDDATNDTMDGETGPPPESEEAPAEDVRGCAGQPVPPSSANADGPSVLLGTRARFELDSRLFQTSPRGVPSGEDGGDTAGEATSEVDDQIRAIERSLRETTSPTVTHQSGMTGRQSISFGFGQWLTGFVLLAVGFALYLARLLWRPFRVNLRHVLERAAELTAATGAVWLTVFVVLPWCIQEIPPFLADLLRFGDGSASPDGATGLDGILAALGISGILAASVKTFLELAVKHGRPHLPLIVKFAVGVLLPLLGVLVFLDQLEFATANGPSGQMLGFGIGMNLQELPAFLVSDLARWVMVLVALALLATVDAHSWSLFPFYKRRLSEAYAIGRTGPDEVAEVPYEEGPILIAPSTAPPRRERWRVLTNVPEREREVRSHGHSYLTQEPEREEPEREEPVIGDGRPGPELVMCCAANVADADVAPPGRRSVSFSVSREVIGSSELGWMDTTEYFDRLGRRRLSDVTLPSLMAISGAAVSPGMGKMSRGPIDTLLALLNVRLGVWLPSPAAVEELPEGRVWRRWPWWGWYLREVFGVFSARGTYLYVSDGGHWENLGLVELFRRGCTEIYCISAAGDGPESFSTIGEALALARELFGVEFDLDLSPLRTPDLVTDPAGPVARPLRRRWKKEVSGDDAARGNTWASSGFVEGTFRYPDGPSCRIVVLEANLTDTIPWDVQAWAEGNEAFPDDPTTDQLFSHRQFESYRALGRCQMERALDAADG